MTDSVLRFLFLRTIEAEVNKAEEFSTILAIVWNSKIQTNSFMDPTLKYWNPGGERRNPGKRYTRTKDLD